MFYIDKYADLLVNYCLSLKKGEQVLVRATTLAEPLLQALQKEASKIGVFLSFDIRFEDQDALFYAHAEGELLDVLPPLYQYAVDHFDAILTIDAPHNTRELKNVPSDKKKRRTAALAPIKRMFMYRSSQKLLKWCLCVYPTPSAAQECGMSLNEFTNFVSHACGLHLESPVAYWLDVHQSQQKIVDYLNLRNTIRFVGPHGTDITFSTKDRLWQNSDGHRNMPSGEVFTSPIEESAQGQIYFSYPTLHDGQDVEGITLRYDKGVLVEWHAKIGQAVLDEAFSIEGSRMVGEIAIGTNRHIHRGTKNILFDEKIGGSIHMAVGASYPETGGLNHSALHWDMITDMRHGGQIYADGKLIYENGHFLGDLG